MLGDRRPRDRPGFTTKDYFCLRATPVSSPERPREFPLISARVPTPIRGAPLQLVSSAFEIVRQLQTVLAVRRVPNLGECVGRIGQRPRRSAIDLDQCAYSKNVPILKLKKSFP